MTTGRRITCRCLFAVAVLGCAASASAAGCTVSSSGLAFGGYQPLSFPGKLVSGSRTSDASISVVCSGIVTGGSYSIALGPSSVGNSTSPRYLGNPQGGPNMAFDVYRDASFASVWGDGATGPLLTGTIPAGNSNQAHTVYGRIPAGQNALRAGAFSATLLMTVTYNP